MNKSLRLLLLLVAGVFLNSCNSMFSEDGCIYYGYVHAQHEFHSTENTPKPSHSQMNMLVFPLDGQGVSEYDNMIVPFDEKGEAIQKLHIGNYSFLIYNKGNNILKLGNGIEEAELNTPVHDGKILSEQHYIYSTYSDGKVLTDDTLRIACNSTVMIQRIIFNIQVTNVPSSIIFNDISAELDGVTTSRFIKSKKKGNGFATLEFTATPGTAKNLFAKEALIFGINNGISNMIRLQLNGTIDYSADVDLSEILKDFNTDGIQVDITVRLSPSTGIATASVEAWHDIEWGDIPVIN